MEYSKGNIGLFEKVFAENAHYVNRNKKRIQIKMDSSAVMSFEFSDKVGNPSHNFSFDIDRKLLIHHNYENGVRCKLLFTCDDFIRIFDKYLSINVLDESSLESFNRLKDLIVKRKTVAKLGSGSFGKVTYKNGDKYVIKQQSVNKLLYPSLPQRKDKVNGERQTFKDEAIILKKLDKVEGINHLIDARIKTNTKLGVDKEQLLLEKVDGETLEKTLKSDYYKQNKIPIFRSIFQQTCEIVNEIHRNGIVHHDIKTDNIMYDGKNNKVTIIDFGLAEIMNYEGHCKHYFGTPFYFPPEFSNGKPSNKIFNGKSHDIWSLGALYFTMKSGYELLRNPIIFHRIDSNLITKYNRPSNLSEYLKKMSNFFNICANKYDIASLINITELVNRLILEKNNNEYISKVLSLFSESNDYNTGLQAINSALNIPTLKNIVPVFDKQDLDIFQQFLEINPDKREQNFNNYLRNNKLNIPIIDIKQTKLIQPHVIEQKLPQRTIRTVKPLVKFEKPKIEKVKIFEELRKPTMLCLQPTLVSKVGQNKNCQQKPTSMVNKKIITEIEQTPLPSLTFMKTEVNRQNSYKSNNGGFLNRLKGVNVTNDIISRIKQDTSPYYGVSYAQIATYKIRSLGKSECDENIDKMCTELANKIENPALIQTRIKVKDKVEQIFKYYYQIISQQTTGRKQQRTVNQ